MGGGNPLKKAEKYTKKYVKETANAMTLGQGEAMTEFAKGATGYGAYSEAKKERARQQALLAKQEKERLKQEALVAAAQGKEDKKTAERKTRLSKGRKGLLYGSATGVKTKLGE